MRPFNLAALRKQHPVPWRADDNGYLVDAVGVVVHSEDWRAAAYTQTVADAVNAWVAARTVDTGSTHGRLAEQLTLPEPDEHAELGSFEPGETAPVWNLSGNVFYDLGAWVRAASASAPMEIAGHEVADANLEMLEHDLLALLAAVRVSRAVGGGR